MAYHSEEYRLSGAEDVHEVFAWAEDTARPAHTFVLYVERVEHGSPGLIHLAGDDPTEGD